MAESNVETLRSFYQRLNETGEPPVDLFDPKLEIRMFEDSPITGPYHGLEGLMRWRDDTFDVIEDWRYELDEVITGDDANVMVALSRFCGRLRHADLPANFPLAVLVRFTDGRISYFEGFRERGEALEAAGLPGPQ